MTAARRPPPVMWRRLTTVLDAMTPGAFGGRVTGVGPVTGSDIDATVAGVGVGSEPLTAPDSFANDAFTASGGAEDLTLTYLPVDYSVHLYLNGVEQRLGTDWTVDGNVVSVDAAMGTVAGDLIDVLYAYASSVPAVPDDDPLVDASAEGPGVPLFEMFEEFAINSVSISSPVSFSDSFERAPLTGANHVGNGWFADSQVTISGGQLVATAAGLVYRTGLAGDAYDITVDFDLNGPEKYHGLQVRVSDPDPVTGSYYYFSVDLQPGSRKVMLTLQNGQFDASLGGVDSVVSTTTTDRTGSWHFQFDGSNYSGSGADISLSGTV